MTLSPSSGTRRTALVTGAGSPTGIGFAAARALGEAGLAVILTSTTSRIQDRVDELRAAGITAEGHVARLDTETGVDGLFAALTSTDTPSADRPMPTVLVNNAGMVTVGDPEMESGDILIDPDQWNRSLASNLTSAFLVSRAVVPAMRRASWGRIVTVSSVTGPAMASRSDVAYAAAKAGMVGLTRALAVDEAPHGITANAVAPGWIATGSQTPGEAEEGLLVPVGRSGTADEIASAIAWLASPGASYITGQVLVVDGGNSVAEERRFRP
ncbi:3-oxoacyl-[acyl-carrier-protein] reductase FabG [Frondihabitans sp. 762G35]|uniref:SDR family NAD(P)-dependent oxidoreductase n=1 Tax=Frondihabitans sp. 762G35 TaxID=1446794 RepID=UPI000D20D96D|nr:SDR family NAD(P)-dependent oxidoreductase [Frondihabitans sp. 762G35]ARC58108.1 3-oxoacyl-[acyl-carrier-protein] reductase FabG [Frondihabitans sp. 762G35]